MIKLTLQPQAEKLAAENPWDFEEQLLYHQWRTYEALADTNLVVNTYNTGTGKTRASLLHLFRLQAQERRRANVLFIAPTNALIHQHAEDIRAFVDRHELEFFVVEINAARLRKIMEGQRPGETLQRLIQNPLTYAESLGIPLHDYRKRPLILVTNPDIFYYALFFRYGSHDQRNIFQKFLTTFDYIVIDEFHYYNSKQLANFLFFFVISQEFGYFADGRRICLLSATPNDYVIEYLKRVFGDDDWVWIAPHNEPSESAELATIPTLTALNLEVVNGELPEWTTTHWQELGDWLDAGQSGALISSALWRINTCYTTLRRFIGEVRLGRITGPEPEEARLQATAVPLILATPTVDIGYNFEKEGKQRQNLDFLICDARYGDELVQRIGRAGRVLGKSVTGQASRAVALLSDDAYQALQAHDGETLSRSDFAALINDCPALPPKQTLYAYIRTHAIIECFYPISQLKRMMPPREELLAKIDTLYEHVRAVFAPHSRKSSRSLAYFFTKHWYRTQWLRQNKAVMTLGLKTAEQFADWIQWLNAEEYKPADFVSLLPQLLAAAEQQEQLREFVESQVALTEALFSFRDSFQGALAVVYDRDHLLSSQTINSYGVMHLVSNYQVRWLTDRREFIRTFGETDVQGNLYGVLQAWRDPRLHSEISYRSPWPRAEFDQRVCRRPVALRGLRLTAREQGGAPYLLDPRIVESFSERHIIVLGVSPEDSGVVYGKLKNSSLYSRPLVVTFPNGQIQEDYRLFLGTQAFFAHAELLGYFLMKDRLKPEAIII
ncbi:MAG TPA: type I-D CRISPR-associated helicase Cas3' [Thermoflexia bacterium]|nr:type I-D CRISPR-associated helicase Cas3' [Thermoflexia bacterium]